MQLIVTSRVSWDDNLWLHSLTNELTEKEQGMEAKGIEVFHNCLNKGMSVEQAQSIAGISGELVQQELQGSSKER